MYSVFFLNVSEKSVLNGLKYVARVEVQEGEQLISAALEELRQLGTSGCSEQIVKYVPLIGTGCGCPDQRLWKPGLCSALVIIKTMRLEDLMAPPCCQAWFQLSRQSVYCVSKIFKTFIKLIVKFGKIGKVLYDKVEEV